MRAYDAVSDGKILPKMGEEEEEHISTISLIAYIFRVIGLLSIASYSKLLMALRSILPFRSVKALRKKGKKINQP